MAVGNENLGRRFIDAETWQGFTMNLQRYKAFDFTMAASRQQVKSDECFHEVFFVVRRSLVSLPRAAG
ncbi:MAG: hypothetical protein LBU43_02120 [Candidatus Accumulibacter sp.]|jgi:hypothetical protein|nr:hypothetical protein [Accumulibacter sp.]